MIYDILLIAVLALFAWRGRKKGLVAGILGFFSVIISYVVSAIISKPLCNIFKETTYYDALLRKIAEIIPKNSAVANDGMLSGFVADSQEMMISHAADFVLGIVISVLAFAAVFIVLKIVIRLLNSVLHLPGLNFLNKFGGLILGTGTGFLLVYIALAVWGVFTLFKLPDGLANSQLVRSMFEYNILFMLIS